MNTEKNIKTTPIDWDFLVKTIKRERSILFLGPEIFKTKDGISLQAKFFKKLAENPTQGTNLGNNCYKIRVAISSKGKGKSGGARLITYVRVLKGIVYLLDIYDKSSQGTISEKELKFLVELLAAE